MDLDLLQSFKEKEIRQTATPLMLLRRRHPYKKRNERKTGNKKMRLAITETH